MVGLRRNAEFMRHFPFPFMKKEPPAQYFWQVYSAVLPQEFKASYDTNLDRMRVKIRKPTHVMVDPEQKRILQAAKEENMRLLMALKQPRVPDNLIHLRRTANHLEAALRAARNQPPQGAQAPRNSVGQPRPGPN